MAAHVRPRRRRVRPPVRPRRRPPAGHRPTELRQRPLQPERADPRVDGARLAGSARRRRQPADRGPVAPLRLQPDDRRRRGHRPGHRRLPARPPRTRSPIGRIDGWGHRTVGLGLQQKLDRSADDPYVHAPRACGRCSTRSTAPTSRSTTSTASRCTTASPPASTSPSTTSGSPGPANRGRRSRTARSSSAERCRSTPAAG